MSVILQIKESTKPGNRVAFAAGVLLGGIIPLATFGVSHFEIVKEKGLFQLPVLLTIGGLVFSAITVYNWGASAFQSKVKAIGFVLLIDGTMVFSDIQVLCYASLTYLVAINAVATATNLVLDARKATSERRKYKPALKLMDKKVA